jgi:hypothetical protein
MFQLPLLDRNPFVGAASQLSRNSDHALASLAAYPSFHRSHTWLARPHPSFAWNASVSSQPTHHRLGQLLDNLCCITHFTPHASAFRVEHCHMSLILPSRVPVQSDFPFKDKSISKRNSAVSITVRRGGCLFAWEAARTPIRPAWPLTTPTRTAIAAAALRSTTCGGVWHRRGQISHAAQWV